MASTARPERESQFSEMYPIHPGKSHNAHNCSCPVKSSEIHVSLIMLVINTSSVCTLIISIFISSNYCNPEHDTTYSISV